MGNKIRRSIATYFFVQVVLGLLGLFAGYGLGFAILAAIVVVLPLALAGYAVLSQKYWAQIPVAIVAILFIAMGLIDMSEYGIDWVNMLWIILAVLDTLIWLKIRKAFPRARANTET